MTVRGRVALTAIAVSALVGCGEGEPQVSLSVKPSSASPGSLIRVTVEADNPAQVQTETKTVLAASGEPGGTRYALLSGNGAPQVVRAGGMGQVALGGGLASNQIERLRLPTNLKPGVYELRKRIVRNGEPPETVVASLTITSTDSLQSG